jgi:hypothetical protein
MATRTAAKAAPKKKPAAAKRAATAKPKAMPASRERATAPRTGTAQKPAAAKAASKKTAAATASAAVPAPARTVKGSSSRRTSGSAAAGKTRTSRAPKPKAMEVSYSGRIFRSRLEARWAVFLDLLDVNWDYEPSFYQVGEDLCSTCPTSTSPTSSSGWRSRVRPSWTPRAWPDAWGAVAGILLGRPFKSLEHGLMPVHPLIAPAGTNLASVTSAAFDIRPDGGVGITRQGPAAGVKAAHRPARLQLLLEAEPRLRAAIIPERITRAYKGAFRLAFDDVTKTVCDRDVLSAVSRRRSNRPLGMAA